MNVLDQIDQMRKGGASEETIISSLRQQGTSPKDINDALNQYQIKNAVIGEPLEQTPANDLPPETQGYAPEYNNQTMGVENYEPPMLPPSPSEEEYYSPQEVPESGAYGSYSNEIGNTTNTFIEIAEQVFLEKTKQTEKKLEDLREFKALANVKLDHALERIKRIEATMDKLQIAILDKVGSYGKNLESIKKEMSMMQDSFGKVIRTHNPKAHTTHSKKK